MRRSIIVSFGLSLCLGLAVAQLAAQPLGETIPVYNGPLSGPLLGSGPSESPVLGVPQLNSRPGAAYTLYLDFAGFNFTGTWGGTGKTPGNTPSFNGNTGTFTTGEQNQIKDFWARVANGYANFDINVTTVDPAVAASQADTDAHRQAYYETQARMMHTVITTSYAWYSPAGGVSYVGVAPYSYSPGLYNGGAGAGWHTNWVFTQGAGMGHTGASAGIHENGHGLGLSHQSDYSATNTNEYSYGDNNAAAGTYAPIMGAAYYVQRGTWRKGNVGNSASIQNDPTILAADGGMNGYVEDGIGHSLATASLLPLSGLNVNPALAEGIINPTSTVNPNPIGVDNYTKDYWKFSSDGIHTVSLTLWDGNDLLATGAQDPDPTLRSKLNILDSSGNLLYTAAEASNTLSETYNGVLPAGTYYAQVTSYGGRAQTLANPQGGNFATTYYYDMGSYFMTGSGLAPVPEPSTIALAAAGCLLLFGRTWQRRSAK